MAEDAGAELLRGFTEAKRARVTWEAHWRECYDHTLPAHEAAERAVPGSKRSNRLFDGTAADAVGQLAASLLAQLTPPWSRWFRLSPGPDVSAEDRAAIAEALERAGEVLQSHFDRSNFAMEAHQCYLDLAVAGTASLLFEEEAPGRGSAFRFTAVPLFETALEEGPGGALDVTWRRSELTDAQLRHRFPDAPPPEADGREGKRRTGVVERVAPATAGYEYRAVLDRADGAVVVASGTFERSPFVNFRWLKAPGESYGRDRLVVEAGAEVCRRHRRRPATRRRSTFWRARSTARLAARACAAWRRWRRS